MPAVKLFYRVLLSNQNSSPVSRDTQSLMFNVQAHATQHPSHLILPSTCVASSDPFTGKESGHWFRRK